jgi:hypothetical protein
VALSAGSERGADRTRSGCLIGLSVAAAVLGVGLRGFFYCSSKLLNNQGAIRSLRSIRLEISILFYVPNCSARIISPPTDFLIRSIRLKVVEDHWQTESKELDGRLSRTRG